MNYQNPADSWFQSLDWVDERFDIHIANARSGNETKFQSLDWVDERFDRLLAPSHFG